MDGAPRDGRMQDEGLQVRRGRGRSGTAGIGRQGRSRQDGHADDKTND